MSQAEIVKKLAGTAAYLFYSKMNQNMHTLCEMGMEVAEATDLYRLVQETEFSRAVANSTDINGATNNGGLWDVFVFAFNDGSFLSGEWNEADEEGGTMYAGMDREEVIAPFRRKH